MQKIFLILISISMLTLIITLLTRDESRLSPGQLGENVPQIPIATSTVRSSLEHAGWTVIVDQPAASGVQIAGDLAGTARAREFIAEKPGTNIRPMITEFTVKDPATLKAALRREISSPIRIGSRDGYRFTIPGIVSSHVFALIGEKQVLYVGLGVREFGNKLEWTVEHLPQEFISLVDQLPIE